MTLASITLSAFGDEIADDLATQLDVLASEDIFHLELRGAWSHNVLDLSAQQLHEAKTLLDERGFGVSAIGSPIGKSALSQPTTFELERLDHAIAAARALDTTLIRVFSFFCAPNEAAQQRDDIIARMRQLTARAAAAGMTLVHENEKGIYGDTAARCHDLITTIDSPALRMAFDPANFVQVGVQPMAEAWPLLADATVHVHIKDAVFADGSIRPPGQGDGAIPELLAALAARGYRGFLTLEPHLKVAGHSSGYSGPDGMRVAAQALKGLMASAAL